MLFRALIAGVVALAAAAPAFAADPRRDEQWGLEMVQAQEAWPTSTGVGAVVAVIDTGVQRDHPDLGGRLVGGFDFVGDDVDDPDTDKDPTDGNGHGTHVTGIVAANRDNGEGIAGVAPGARVMPLRVLDDSGEGYADDTIKAIDYAIDHGADVINLSLGDFIPLQSTLFDDPAYKSALERAVDAGIVVVIAGRQQHAAEVREPGCRRDALRGRGGQSPAAHGVFSSYGSNVDLMAPGRVVRGRQLGGHPLERHQQHATTPSAARRRPRHTSPGLPRCWCRSGSGRRRRPTGSSPPRRTRAWSSGRVRGRRSRRCGRRRGARRRRPVRATRHAARAASRRSGG